ncbi:MAG: HEPN/Toprim-associated domain-containing protein [candidate division KSB1 bacterium]|nr:HEPN/Toprim-associated domain-containing protein [candidate division KSB1 bacterium]
MGTYSHLRINKLVVSWSKNFQMDHTTIFENADRGIVDYYFADDEVIQMPGYQKNLSDCTSVLKFFGYDAAKVEFELNKKFHDEGIPISYSILTELFERYGPSIFKNRDFVEGFHGDCDFGNYSCYLIKKQYPEIRNKNAESISSILNGLHEYEIIAMLSTVDSWLDQRIVWETHDLIESGWSSEIELYNLFNQRKAEILIVTEGKSDSEIIKRAFEKYYPSESKSIEFIDMKENYPFTGTGNIANFYLGLCKIGVKRKILFIFDNDTEGNKAKNKCEIVNDKYIRCTTLPVLSDFDNFRTIGPSGEAFENVNTRAVAIEMFLDQNNENDIPTIRWTNFDKEMNAYQGSLVDKEKYIKPCLQAFESNSQNYNFERLKKLAQHVWEEMATLNYEVSENLKKEEW